VGLWGLQWRLQRDSTGKLRVYDFSTLANRSVAVEWAEVMPEYQPATLEVNSKTGQV